MNELKQRQRVHTVANLVVTQYENDGRPRTRPATETGQKIACYACGQQGWPPSEWPSLNAHHWLRRHTHHVLCTCGKIVSVIGFAAHVASSKAHGR